MTTQIPLSRGLVALVDDSDAAALTAAGPWHAVPGGRTFHARRNERRDDGWHPQYMHTFLTGLPLVDHANGNGLDNRRGNLRAATSAQNAANRPTRLDSRSGLKGVYANRGRGKPWRAQICVDGKKRHLGLFLTAEEAALAYDTAALAAWGEFAVTNIIKKESVA